MNQATGDDDDPELGVVAFDWTPGTVRLQQDGKVLVIFCGEGLYRGMLRIGQTTLQYAPQRYDEPKKTRAWEDATELWPRFPKWLRLKATETLHLGGG